MPPSINPATIMCDGVGADQYRRHVKCRAHSEQRARKLSLRKIECLTFPLLLLRRRPFALRALRLAVVERAVSPNGLGLRSRIDGTEAVVDELWKKSPLC